MSQQALYSVSLLKADDKLSPFQKQAHDTNQTRLNANFSRISEMMSELYGSVGQGGESVEVPKKLSELENDTGFITQEAVPTKVSELENDAGYITEAGGAEITLLWTNPSTTTAFAAQTTSINLADYDYVAITMMAAYNSDAQNESHLQIVPVDGNERYVYALHASGAYYFTRGVTVNKNGVTWTRGVRNGSKGDGYCIPSKVYGIRGLKNADL